MSALAKQVQTFAVILTPRRGTHLPSWIETTRSLQLPGFNQFLDGLITDRQAVIAGLTLPYSNGPIEGANTKVKLLKRQMYGRTWVPATPPPDPAQLTGPRNLSQSRKLDRPHLGPAHAITSLGDRIDAVVTAAVTAEMAWYGGARAGRPLPPLSWDRAVDGTLVGYADAAAASPTRQVM